VARAVTVRVFQKAIEELADDPNDPVNEVLDGLAEEVRRLALQNARKILPQLPEDFLTVTTGKDSKGLFFRVEPDGQGRWSSYLTWKEFREQAWLAPAIADVVGQGSIRRAGVQERRRTFPRGAGFSL
jgi:hypothetical protein